MRRKLMVLLALCLFAVPVMAQQADSITVTPNELAERIIQEAKKHIGTPYRWAANGPSAFDCSGFTRYVYKQFGYSIPRTARNQGETLRPVLGDMSSLQKGDLILFGNHWNNKTIGHVGIFIELSEDGRDFTFIHSAHGGVQISRLSEQYYLERFKGAVRVIPDFIDIEEEENPQPMRVEAFDGVTAPQLDTLQLGDNDRRIIIFGDGKWVYVEADGSITTPEQSDRIVLGSDGSWFILRGTGVRIPSIIESNDAAHAYESGSGSGSSSGGSGPVYYTVKSGDTLGKIANKYHTTVNTLCRLNNMRSTDILKVGRRLRVK
jgi:hypothetical protein